MRTSHNTVLTAFRNIPKCEDQQGKTITANPENMSKTEKLVNMISLFFQCLCIYFIFFMVSLPFITLPNDRETPLEVEDLNSRRDKFIVKRRSYYLQFLC
jgi:hypothetical protein